MLPVIWKLIGTAVTFGLIAMIGWLVGSGGGWRRAADGVRVLGYVAFIRGAGVLAGVVVPLLILIIGLWGSPPNKPGDWWAWGGLIVGFGLGGGWLMLEGFRTQVILTSDGIAKFHWWYRSRFVAWGDVERIDSRLLSVGDYAVRTRLGTPLGVPGPQFFGPAEWFREACQEHLRPDQYPEAFTKKQNG